MGYHIYTTDGIILKRKAFGEADVVLYVLTSDLGLISASAKSARLFLSKLRPALQDYSLSSISCIKAKNGWKITNALEKENFFFSSNIYHHRVLSQIVSLLIKMIPGESPQKEIFETVKTGFKFLRELKEDKEIESFEILLVLRILDELGYIGQNEEIKGFTAHSVRWDKEILNNVQKSKKVIVLAINKALKESHL